MASEQIPFDIFAPQQEEEPEALQPSAVLGKRALNLKQMVEEGVLTHEQAMTLQDITISLAEAGQSGTKARSSRNKETQTRLTSQANRASTIARHLIEQLFGLDSNDPDNLIYTSLNYTLRTLTLESGDLLPRAHSSSRAGIPSKPWEGLDAARRAAGDY